MPDPRAPFVNPNEPETLVAFPCCPREEVVAQSAGLSPGEAHGSLAPSGTWLLGLVKHLTMVEVSWFQWSFAGDDVWVPTDRVSDTDTVASVISTYRAATARNNEIV